MRGLVLREEAGGMRAGAPTRSRLSAVSSGHPRLAAPGRPPTANPHLPRGSSPRLPFPPRPRPTPARAPDAHPSPPPAPRAQGEWRPPPRIPSPRCPCSLCRRAVSFCAIAGVKSISRRWGGRRPGLGPPSPKAAAARGGVRWEAEWRRAARARGDASVCSQHPLSPQSCAPTLGAAGSAEADPAPCSQPT